MSGPPGPPGPSRGRGRGRALAPTPVRRPPAPTNGTPSSSTSTPAKASASTTNPTPPNTDFSKPLPAPRQIGTLRDPPPRPGAAGSGVGSVGSQAKKVEEGAARPVNKMRFIPKLPAARHRKEIEDVKPPTPPVAGRGTPFSGPGRGRGAPSGSFHRAEPSFTASGPFALGPSAQALSRRPTRSLPSYPSHSTSGPSGPSSSSSRKPAIVVADAEQYSDEEDGVEIVDLDQVEGMDDMAPVSLKRMRIVREGAKKLKRTESEVPGAAAKDKGKGKAKAEPEDDSTASLHSSTRPTAEPESPEEDEDKDLANALDLDESDEGEEMEDMLEDFYYQSQLGEAVEDDPTRERFYFFQFPAPFPTFIQPIQPGETIDVTMADPDPDPEPDAVAAEESDTLLFGPPKNPTSSPDEKGKKTVAFAKDVKPESKGAEKKAVSKAEEPKEKEKEKKLSKAEAAKLPPPRVDGLIGRMEVYADGRVRIVLGDDIFMEVHPAAEMAFLENVVHLDPTTRQMTSLGPVEKRFVVSPDLDKLLGEMEVRERVKKEGGVGVKLE